jgi:SAM-dependent methyltransferase
METQPVAPPYVLGHSEAERQRLIKQSSLLRPSTERVFRKAGIADGMRVLDLGCGVGDVSFLAAELVGPKGSVVGIDRNPDVLDVARRRAHENGFTQVTFEQQAVDSVKRATPFDAVVGRFVLMYQADPVAALAHAFSLLRTGGILVVQEPDFGVGIATWPEVALWRLVTYWIAETFRRAGVHHDIGGKLYHLFRQAGLPGPLLLEHVSVGGGPALRPFCENITEIVKSLLPAIEQFDVATAAEVQVNTLAMRLERDACAAESQVTYMPLVAAWTTKG